MGSGHGGGSAVSDLAPVALVRTLGQVGMPFTLFNRFYFKEALRRTDIAGLMPIVFGVVLVLPFH